GTESDSRQSLGTRVEPRTVLDNRLARAWNRERFSTIAFRRRGRRGAVLDKAVDGSEGEVRLPRSRSPPPDGAGLEQRAPARRRPRRALRRVTELRADRRGALAVTECARAPRPLSRPGHERCRPHGPRPRSLRLPVLGRVPDLHPDARARG